MVIKYWECEANRTSATRAKKSARPVRATTASLSASKQTKIPSAGCTISILRVSLATPLLSKPGRRSLPTGGVYMSGCLCTGVCLKHDERFLSDVLMMIRNPDWGDVGSRDAEREVPRNEAPYFLHDQRAAACQGRYWVAAWCYCYLLGDRVYEEAVVAI
jgi:hypothetical protein